MHVCRGLPLTAGAPVALTIGNFDGVHRGHQAMLARLLEAADDLALTPTVLTFDPHPREFFARTEAPPRLSTVRHKLEAFQAAGVRRVIIARFDGRLASLTPETFVASVLVERLGVRWLLVGEDFRFGKGRAGDLSLLRRSAGTFSVEAMRTLAVDGTRASSTAVRAALAEGNLERARAMLGRPFAMSGRIIHGAKLGRRIGMPTANIALRRKPPLSGIYAVRVQGLGAAPRIGVASVGVRPTVTASGVPLLEVHIFDFDETIYGRRVSVEFARKLRDEARYPDVETLTRQMHRDVAEARDFFGAASVLTH